MPPAPKFSALGKKNTKLYDSRAFENLIETQGFQKKSPFPEQLISHGAPVFIFFPCVVWTFLTKWLQYSDFVEKVSIVIIVDVYIYFLLFM